MKAKPTGDFSRDHPQKSTGRLAFSLVELLVVMAILVLLSAFATLGLSSLGRASRLGTGLSKSAAFIDQARNFAVANGMFIYMGTRTLAGADPAVEFVLVGSPNGEDLSSKANLSVGIDEISLLARPLRVSQVSYSTDTSYQPPVARPDAGVLDAGGQKIMYNGNSYDTVLAFGPSGMVTFGGAVPSLVEFGLRSSGRTNLAGVIQVAGLTGMTHVFQQ